MRKECISVGDRFTAFPTYFLTFSSKRNMFISNVIAIILDNCQIFFLQDLNLSPMWISLDLTMGMMFSKVHKG